MTNEQSTLVMRYYDGELEGDELAEFERRLAREPELSELVGGLEQLGDVLRAHAGARAETFDVADLVLAKLDAPPASQEAPPASERGQVIRGSFPAVAAALAVAASLVVWLTGGGPEQNAEPPRVAETAPLVVPPPAPLPEPAAEPQIQPEELAPAVAIESVDFGPRNGAIFMVSAGAETTPVVWLADESAASADPTESP